MFHWAEMYFIWSNAFLKTLSRTVCIISYECLLDVLFQYFSFAFRKFAWIILAFYIDLIDNSITILLHFKMFLFSLFCISSKPNLCFNWKLQVSIFGITPTGWWFNCKNLPDIKHFSIPKLAKMTNYIAVRSRFYLKVYIFLLLFTEHFNLT